VGFVQPAPRSDVVDVPLLVEQYRFLSDVGDRKSLRRLVRPRPMSDEAGLALLSARYPELWRMAALSSPGMQTIQRLVEIADIDVDCVLALRATDSLSAEQTDVVAGRLVGRARYIRDSHDRASSRSYPDRSTLNLLVAAGDALLRTGALSDGALDVARFCATPGAVMSWLTGNASTKPREHQLRQLLNSPNHAFGEQIYQLTAALDESVRGAVVSFELLRKDPQRVADVLRTDWADAWADALGPALLRHAQLDARIENYLLMRVRAACSGSLRNQAAAHAMLAKWPDGMASLSVALKELCAS
jgi:hypothetical protein